MHSILCEMREELKLQADRLRLPVEDYRARLPGRYLFLLVAALEPLPSSVVRSGQRSRFRSSHLQHRSAPVAIVTGGHDWTGSRRVARSGLPSRCARSMRMTSGERDLAEAFVVCRRVETDRTELRIPAKQMRRRGEIPPDRFDHAFAVAVGAQAADVCVCSVCLYFRHAGHYPTNAGSWPDSAGGFGVRQLAAASVTCRRPAEKRRLRRPPSKVLRAHPPRLAPRFLSRAPSWRIVAAQKPWTLSPCSDLLSGRCSETSCAAS